MNIKSVLFGSAAALIAVSSAHAADAVVVAEPEPAEYVKICDVYGAGYFYIPGTETCLRVGGYVRYDIGVGDREGVQNVTDHRGGGFNDTYWKQGRFALMTWTGSETELGTLKTYTETRFNFGNTPGDYDPAVVDPADADRCGQSARDRGGALPVDQHRQGVHQEPVPQARCGLTARRRRHGPGARPHLRAPGAPSHPGCGAGPGDAATPRSAPRSTA